MFVLNVSMVVDRTGKHTRKHVGSSTQETSRGRRLTTTEAFCTPLLTHLVSFLQRKIDSRIPKCKLIIIKTTWPDVTSMLAPAESVVTLLQQLYPGDTKHRCEEATDKNISTSQKSFFLISSSFKIQQLRNFNLTKSVK